MNAHTHEQEYVITDDGRKWLAEFIADNRDDIVEFAATMPVSDHDDPKSDMLVKFRYLSVFTLSGMTVPEMREWARGVLYGC
jgi:hypothetical protein